MIHIEPRQLDILRLICTSTLIYVLNYQANYGFALLWGHIFKEQLLVDNFEGFFSQFRNKLKKILRNLKLTILFVLSDLSRIIAKSQNSVSTAFCWHPIVNILTKISDQLEQNRAMWVNFFKCLFNSFVTLAQQRGQFLFKISIPKCLVHIFKIE